ncbi:MAG TPA: hypothetical protein VIV10_08775 [Gemmatimonadales bacterium]
MVGKSGGQAGGRSGGGRTVQRGAACLAVLLSALPPVRLTAQVGHNPGASPYHDLRRGAMLRLVGGYFGGERGKIPVGASHGWTGGLRFEYQASNVIIFTTGIAYAQTDAFYVTARESPPDTVGPVNNDLVLADAGLQISLTGGKTFHGLLPYIGGTVGLAFGSPIAADTSGYDFGTKITAGPEAGIRWYPGRRVSFELGGRIVYYRLQYPAIFRLALLPPNASLTEWTAHPWATFGVAWTF